MKTITIAFRSLFKKKRNNPIKIASLSVGLAMGLILIAKVYYEQTYDDFPNADRIYRIGEMGTINGGPFEHPLISGGVAPALADEIADIETATRFTVITRDETFVDSNRKKYKAGFIVADSVLFDIFPQTILAGDPKDILTRPMYAMISEKTANMLGGTGAAVGQVIELSSHPGRTVTVGGVFKDFPHNSHLNFDVIMSLKSISAFTSDGSNGWIGNDRYYAYARMVPGVEPQSIEHLVTEVVNRHRDPEMMKKAGVDITYTFIPLPDVHRAQPDVKRLTALLSLLAFALLLTAMLNYILIMVSSLVKRSKEMAVNKCYGASAKNIYGKILAEAFVDIVASLFLSILLIIAFQDTVQDLLGTSPSVMINWRSGLLLGSVCVIVLLITGLVPGYMYAKIPVASAFRNYKENQRFWKLGLLFIQIVASGFFAALLVIIVRQYTMMLNDSPGYEYENVAYCTLHGTDVAARRRALNDISRLPEVVAVSNSQFMLPIMKYSGNNVTLPGSDEILFNLADGYSVGDGFHSLFNIPIIEGKSFTEGIKRSNEVIVDRNFVDRIVELTGWTDGVIGKQVMITAHSGSNENPFPLTIVGVNENYRIGFIGSEANRPSALFYECEPGGILVFKYKRFTPETNAKVYDILADIFPDKEINLYSYAAEMASGYSDTRRFRDSVIIGGAVTILITIIGLIAYIRDEINRRRKETAIRKINGATLREILQMFLRDVGIIAVPALIIGGGISAYVAFNWQAQFSEKTSLSPFLFLACGFVIMTVILVVVAIHCYQAANENPAVVIKSE